MHRIPKKEQLQLKKGDKVQIIGDCDFEDGVYTVDVVEYSSYRGNFPIKMKEVRDWPHYTHVYYYNPIWCKAE